MNKLRLIYSSTVAAKLAVIFAVVITVWAELSVPLKDWLKSVSGHHWATKSYLTMLVYTVIFACVYAVAKDVSGSKVRQALNYLILLALAGTAVLIGFYIWHLK